MKKMIHVGILSIGLLLSNAVLADDFADMRNNPNNMTATQAAQVEAGSWAKAAVNGVKNGAIWVKNKIWTPKVKATVQGASYANDAYQVYEAVSTNYDLGAQCR